MVWLYIYSRKWVACIHQSVKTALCPSLKRRLLHTGNQISVELDVHMFFKWFKKWMPAPLCCLLKQACKPEKDPLALHVLLMIYEAPWQIVCFNDEKWYACTQSKSKVIFQTIFEVCTESIKNSEKVKTTLHLFPTLSLLVVLHINLS